MMPNMPPGAMPQEQMQEQMPDEEMMPEEANEPSQGGLTDLVMDKMQEDGFAEQAMTALEGAKDIGAAAGMMAGVLVSKMYNPGDSDEDVMDAIGEALKELLSIAQDMGVQIDEQTATTAAQQAGEMVIGMMDQHEGAEMPQEGQEQGPQGMANPYEGMA